MLTFINPKTDFAFKKIFGSPQSKDVLISFLNALLYPHQATQIQDLTILDPYQAARTEGLKDSYLDVKAILSNQTTVIIEMQVLNVLGFKKRILYNAAKAFAIQLKMSESYTLLNPVIALTITDFEMFESSTEVISRYLFKEKHRGTEYSEDIELVFVELPKFKRTLEELEDLTDKWIYFLRSAHELQTVPSNLAEIQTAFEIARQSLLTPEELDILKRKEMFLHDSRNAILKAQQEGQATGQAIGQAIGEQKAKASIARSLLGLMSLETISQVTNLSLEEVQQLTQESPDQNRPQI